MADYIIEPNIDGSSSFHYITSNTLPELPSVTTGKCYRCFGGMILMKKKKNFEHDTEVPNYGLLTYHITPGNRKSIRAERRFLKKLISSITLFFEPVSAMRAGGRIDSEMNKFLYREMSNKIENTLRLMFPHLVITGYEPKNFTYYMIMYSYFDQQKQDVIMTTYHYSYTPQQT